MLNKESFARFTIGALTALVGLLLTIIGFFSAKTYASIERLVIDVNELRYELGKLEAARITRSEIRELIRDYHDSHPQHK